MEVPIVTTTIRMISKYAIAGIGIYGFDETGLMMGVNR